MNKVKCPLCETGDMLLTELKSDNKAMENKSYMWVCEDCPGILLEWWDSDDQKAFNKRLMGDRSDVIKEWDLPDFETNAGVKDHLLKERKDETY